MPRALAILSLWVLLLPSLAPAAAPAAPPEDFVDAAAVVPSLIVELRYHGEHNFLGTRVDGYQAPRCLLTRKAAEALAKAQAELLPLGLALKVYDCYRPVRSVSHFVRWAKDLDDVKTKAEFYPAVDKRDLFKLGYIAERSSHNRGGTVDLTIVPLPAAPQPVYVPGQPLVACFEPVGRRYADNGLDMGTGYDCFSDASHPGNLAIGPQQRANRALLRTLMEKHGFQGIAEEWWHFTLREEPHPETYFDFPVE